MIYKEFQDLKLSSLGFGAMRLPTLGVQPDAAIDEEKTAGMIARAIEKGVNYFDTAYGYHNGQSEVICGFLLYRL
ncbi:MAG TPA: aldo/keto reductase [Candidatus Blautia stercoravium]|nr:aldo/keto reductase [Candidatus Blautia stercoravium]